MGGRRAKKHEHVNHERWLVSYADFITLLFAFFVVMFAVSQVDSRKLGRFVESVNVAFQLNGVFPETQGSPLERGGGGSSIVAPVVANRPSLFAHAPASRRAERVHDALAERFQRGSLAGVVSLRHDPRGVALALPVDLLFAAGGTVLQERAHSVLHEIADALRGEPGPLQIEAHAPGAGSTSSGWETSASRSAAVARFLAEECGLAPDRLAAVSLAGSRELAGILELADPEGIEIVLVTEGTGD